MIRNKILKKIICTIMPAVFLITACTPISVSEAKKTAAWPSGPQKSSLSCDSAIVMELSTGTVLYKKNIHKQHYPASITKIMTALLTAENCSLSETVKFSESAVYGIESGSSTIYTEVGEVLTIEQCLYAIMLESANEVCLGVGEHIAGSVSEFVDMMNERVKELGLTDTHFNNPNGLPDSKHYTTAYDMAVIAREAMQNSTFKKVVGTKSYTAAKTNKHKTKRIWNNHHQMLNGYQWPQYEYKYCIGGKTGYTDAAQSTLVTYAEKDGMQLVCVIMYAKGPKQGQPNEYTDTTSLLNSAFENYQKHTIDEEISDINDDLFNNYDSYFNTEESPIRLAGEASVVLPKGADLSDVKQSVSYDEDVSLTTGENIIGNVTYTYGKKTVGSTDIIYTKSEESTETHLNAASRKIVSSEIAQVEETEKKEEQKANFWRKIKNAIVGIFKIRLVQIVLLLLAIAIAICGIMFAARKITLPTFSHSKRKRMSGGYRSKRARGQYRKQQRLARKNERTPSRKTRRNFSRHYEKQSPRKGRERRSRGVRYNKNHKRTKESFGKNFFDF